jgi:hypothetical protein
MGGAPVESLTVTAPQYRTLVALPDGQFDRPRGPGDEGHGGGLVPLALGARGSTSAEWAIGAP